MYVVVNAPVTKFTWRFPILSACGSVNQIFPGASTARLAGASSTGYSIRALLEKSVISSDLATVGRIGERAPPTITAATNNANKMIRRFAQS